MARDEAAEARIRELEAIVQRMTPVVEAVSQGRGDSANLRTQATGIMDDLKPKEERKYRIVWWQSLIQGMVDGETLDSDLTEGQARIKFIERRIDFKDAYGVQLAIAPMSFIPKGDNKQEEHDDAEQLEQ